MKDTEIIFKQPTDLYELLSKLQSHDDRFAETIGSMLVDSSEEKKVGMG